MLNLSFKSFSTSFLSCIPCSLAKSQTISLIFLVGFNAFIAYCGIIDNSLYWIFLASSLESFIKSFPLKIAFPPLCVIGGFLRIREWTRVDFPQPLSPAIPNTSPFLTSKLTPSTAFTKPLGVE
ncbi:123aa long hypothetical protein [Pyrococcus horikoshii OT3]|uniref:Uncharacterized protein n=1 Tax=Pyrococcus horikoshii (strain ATCC 700860 / DSM 12428 / JCM 9974 / NBRC 100139 / OT-3) TaxID=70601 RepID=O58242_PYRHO|nr:123aa long hypothetical protein [Pyrococcus horikoshii OT3]